MNGHGGARPGAGRKRKSTRERQEANREIVLRAVDRATLEGMVARLVVDVLAGNTKAFGLLAPYLLGAPTQQLEHTGPEGGPVAVVSAGADFDFAGYAQLFADFARPPAPEDNALAKGAGPRVPQLP